MSPWTEFYSNFIASSDSINFSRKLKHVVKIKFIRNF